MNNKTTTVSVIIIAGLLFISMVYSILHILDLRHTAYINLSNKFNKEGTIYCTKDSFFGIGKYYKVSKRLGYTIKNKYVTDGVYTYSLIDECMLRMY